MSGLVYAMVFLLNTALAVVSVVLDGPVVRPDPGRAVLPVRGRGPGREVAGGAGALAQKLAAIVLARFRELAKSFPPDPRPKR